MMKTVPLVVLALSLIAAAASPPTTTARPNVVIVIYDDQSWLECGAYGSTSVPTPHFDRVAERGVLFTHAFTSSPSCAPSRAALLTGRHFWELKQGAFIQAWLPQKFAVLPDLLDAAGYFTGFTGKGWGPGVVPPAGRSRNPAGRAFNTEKRRPAEPGINSIDYVANLARFLDARPAAQPFYFWIGATEPHEPHAPDNHTKLGIPLDDVRVPAFHPDTEGVRRHRANYLYEVGHADRTLGAVITLLEQRGELANTLLIVTADNGTPGPRMKTEVYDWGVRVPLAMMWPGRIPPGRRVADFINFADLAPTILEATGSAVPREMTGRSALAVLRSERSGQVDPTRTWTAAGLEWHGTLHGAHAARLLRDHRYAYIVNYTLLPRFEWEGVARADEDYPTTARDSAGEPLLQAHRSHPALQRYVELLQAPRPREELYDCYRDPWQLTNLAADPAYAGIKARLRAQLKSFQSATRDPRETGEMRLFEETLAFVQSRKRSGYTDGRP